ncbi:MAG: DUF1559 domain-containing protein [Pirellulaceae bacterium]|nr:DUF1559 domain-containing protein [Pirellulaceae bacterium]MDG1809895.1 DUF1559 domain-containing protein [Pirellulaceae bacterium]MDG2105159.1 DUF1559 domain-containing protein [Pirellulaceae bacterium]
MFSMAFTELALLILFSMGGQTGIPLGMPPGPEDPMMAQFAPENCLLYTTWSPTTAIDPSKNVTEAWMAQAEVQTSFSRLKEAVRKLAAGGDAEEATFGRVGSELAEKCLSRSVGFYLSKFGALDAGPVFEGGALVDLGSGNRQLMTDITEVVTKLAAYDGYQVDTFEHADVACWTFTTERMEIKNTVTWGFINERYLAITVGEGEMQRLIGNVKTDAPAWLIELRNELSVDRVSSVTWLNIAGFLEATLLFAADEGAPNEGPEPIFNILGIDQLKTAGWVSGLDADGFICRGTLHAEGELKGIMGLIAGESLEPEVFEKVADDRMFVLGSRVSVPKILQLIRDLDGMDERSAGQVDQNIADLGTAIGIDIEEDVISNFDEYAYLYGSINITNPTAGWVLGIGIAGEMAFTETYTKINEFIETIYAGSDAMAFNESDVAGTTVYSLKDTSEWGVMPNFSWALSEGELLISMDRSTIRRHLRRESLADDALVKDEWFSRCFSPPSSDAEGPLIVSSVDIPALIELGMPLLGTFGNDLFPEELDFSIADLPSSKILTKQMKPNLSALFRTPEGFEIVQRQTYPGGTPGSFLGGATVSLMPAFLTVRKAANRTDSANRMRQLLLAMHNYHDVNGALPARFSQDGDGKPLLSWRVHILPYIEEGDLYSEFHLDEPWDSEHNKALVARMPQAFSHPRAKLDSGKTVYLVPTGNSVIQSPEESVDDTANPTGLKLEQITDGSSRTAMLLEADPDNAVIWTQPNDFDWKDREDPGSSLFHGWGDGVNVGFADGSIHYIKFTSLREVFRILMEPDDGEVAIWSDD